MFGQKLPDEVAKRVPPGQRLVKTWPVLQYGPIPAAEGSEWTLEVSGLVEEPFTLTYDELKALGPQDVTGILRIGGTILGSTTRGRGSRSASSPSARSRPPK